MSVILPGLALASYSDAPLPTHSGPLESSQEGHPSLHRTHPNGDGLRGALAVPSFVAHEGSGNPCGPSLIIADAMATLIALCEAIARYPHLLFEYVTAPPLRAGGSEPRWKCMVKQVLKRSTLAERQQASARLVGLIACAVRCAGTGA